MFTLPQRVERSRDRAKFERRRAHTDKKIQHKPLADARRQIPKHAAYAPRDHSCTGVVQLHVVAGMIAAGYGYIVVKQYYPRSAKDTLLNAMSADGWNLKRGDQGHSSSLNPLGALRRQNQELT
jgi:hypothetical protein